MIEDYIDEDVAYLLGLITSRGFIREFRTREIIIEFPGRKKFLVQV
ncbi:MAG: hypothetical protein KIH08_13285 [Candidatus Freyarchaeota archaeon]|nr:hypothetical protein [Candidatus Jordarchaeia archaeon]